VEDNLNSSEQQEDKVQKQYAILQHQNEQLQQFNLTQQQYQLLLMQQQ
jgi:hypothetical protein